jgi:broad specificity phosphatase PhoE
MRITLLRHGEPSFALGGSVRARDLPDIAKAYEESGIVGAPPTEVINAVKNHAVVRCSDLRRAVESVHAPGLRPSAVEIDHLFRETAIPHFDRGALRLPVSAWVVLLRALWFLGFSKNGESFADMKIRARAAANELVALALQYQSVLLVGHGFMNRYIARNLLEAGWRGPGAVNQKYWSQASYQYAPT